MQGDDRDAAVDALLVASRALVAVAARSLAGIDITLPQYRALVVVWSRPGVSVNDLAAALDTHPTTATRMCDRLVGKRLLRRAQAEADRRTVELHLTASGRRLVQRVTEARRHDIGAIVARLDPPLADEAVQALAAFAEAADEVPLEVDPVGWSGPDP